MPAISRKLLWMAAFLIFGGLAVWGYLSLAGSLPGSLRVGDPVPSFALPRLGGGSFRLEEARGVPVVLRVSSRSCAFCSNDFAALEAFQNRYGPRLQVIALETESSLQEVERAVGAALPSYPVVVDAGGLATAAWPIRGLPMFFVLDRTGRLYASARGEISAVDLDRLVAPLLPVPPEPGSVLFQELFRQAATQVRCQECEGLSVWDSSATSSWTSRVEIQERLAQGWTVREILHWFEDRYGVWILMSPPARGGLTWVWVVPGLAFLAGVGLVLRYLRRREPAEGPGKDGTGAEDLPPDIRRRLEEYL